jgi:single-strand DNA-binding protein
MNSLTITGNLGKDAEMRSLPDGTSVLSFSVADNQGKDKPSIWWNCALFGKRADALAQYLTKGQQVTVVGNVTEREWTDKDGAKRKSMDVRVGDVALQGGKPQQSEPSRPAAPAQGGASTPGAFDDLDDSIPF